MKKFCLLLQRLSVIVTLFLVVTQNAHSATLVSSVDRNRVSINQTVTLSVQYDKQVNSSKLDLAGLESNFDVLSVSPQTSSSTTFVNGKLTKEESTTWRITLAPKREGDLIIPQLTLDANKTRAITIKVLNDSQAANGNNNQALSVSVSTNTRQAYVGQQFLFEIEISAAENVSNLSGPKIEITNSDVELLEQKSKQRLENGLIRQVILLKYAVFTNQPGKIEIPAMIYTATQGGRRSVFNSNRGKRVVARSAPISLNIQAIDTTHSPWFPADNVSITSHWSGDISQMTVGEPITRSVTITAKGQRASAIPPLQNTTSTDYKSYKDQAQLDDGKTENGYLATRIESEAIVASNEGELILPEQRIRWWDVHNSQWKEAILPSEKVNVAANTKVQNNQIIEQQLTPQNTVATEVGTQKSHWLWPILCAILALICLIQTWFIFQLKTNATEPSHPLGKQQNLTKTKAWKDLQKALTSSDPQTIRQAILNWGQSFSESRQFNTLDKIAEYSDDTELNLQLKQAFNALEANLYKDNTPFNSQALVPHIRALNDYLIDQKRKTSSDEMSLKPLYKS